MRREAPMLGAGVGRQARKRAGFGGWDCLASGSPVRLLPFDWSTGVGMEEPMPGGWSARNRSAGDGRRVFFRSQVFR